MSREHMEAVQRSLEAWNRGDVDGMLTQVTDESEYAIAELNPNARLLRGRDEIAAYLRDWLDTLSGLHYEAHDIRDVGERVLVLGTMTGRVGAEDGPELTAELAFVLRFDGDVVVRTEEYLDASDALAAVGV